MKSPIWTLVTLLLLLTALHAADPVVSNVTAAQRAGTKLVDISFQVSDEDLDLVNMSVNVSDDSGLTFNVPSTALSGDISINAAPVATSHALVWDAGIDFNQQFNSSMVVRVIADDGSGLGPAPPGMSLIPGGKFKMGDQQVPPVGETDELPVHEVYISTFYVDIFEVTLELWREIRNWGLANGYADMPLGQGEGARHPVHSIDWYAAVKWCNARSEKEGLLPVYYTDASHRTMDLDLQNDFVLWTANGYRLPTEAEWEKAARGGLVANQYPSGQGMTGSDSNYNGSGDPFETGTTPVGFYDSQQWTSYIINRANGFGLYDMGGNISEMCWDWLDAGWYSTADAVIPDSRGPQGGNVRVARGGAFFEGVEFTRCASRDFFHEFFEQLYGFRCARGL